MRLTISTILLVLFLGLSSISAQVRISGYVRDADSGEELINATVFAPDLGVGTFTNSYGFYSLDLPKGDTVKVVFKYVGYGVAERKLYLSQDSTLNIDLASADKVLEDVVIEAESFKEEINSSQMSVTSLSMVQAKKLPALFGEVDIIKTLQLKPGIQSGSEGSSGLYVRGGGPDQNLILLDEAPVYNANHLFGFFSTFNSDAVKDVKLYKGGFPAEYGGRLSSVIDVRLNEGNMKKFSGAGGLGLIASRLTLEGPIVKDKASFVLSGRRTYADIFTRLINNANQDNEDYTPIPDYYFYDLNAKLNYKISDKDRIFLSGYLGRDVFGFGSDNFDINFNWGNATGTLRWNHLFSPRFFANTAVTYSQYDYKIQNEVNIVDVEVSSGIKDWNGHTDFTWLPNNQHRVKFGASATYHTFEVGRFNASAEDSTFNFALGQNFYGSEFGAYISDDFEVNPRLKINGGVRLSGFTNGNSLYVGAEPRASAKYSLSENLSLKASYTRMFQYVHLVSNSGASLPTDIWFPSTDRVRPQRSDQAAFGVSFLIADKFLLTNETYYKWMKNQIDFRDGAQLFVNDNLEDEFVFGKGYGYGNEIFLEKKSGKTTGWIGYTLSWTWREFAEINDGRRFHPRYDRRHDVTMVVIQELSKRLSLTGAWVYGTGNAVSLPVGRMIVSDPISGGVNLTPIYTDRNAFRMPSYHRLDLGLILKFFPKWGEADLTFSAYNTYSRRNPYFIYFDTVSSISVPDGNGGSIELPTQFQAKQVSLFPIIPSVTFNFKF